LALRNEPVAKPEKRVTYKSSKNGTVYVYYTLRSYRNKDGKPTSDEVSIGKKDSTTGDLIPNRRYYEIFQDSEALASSQPLSPKTVRSCGNVAALLKASDNVGLTGILKDCFPDRWDRLLAAAFYIVCQGNVMMYIEDWFDETEVSFTKRMDDVDCSKLFASITDEDRSVFFTQWVKYRNEKEYIAYDVSSISTHSRNIDIAEYGYNRDDENLPQLNLGMYYGVSSHVPVYYDLYSGSIPDKAYLEFMMTTAKDLGISEVCYVMDRGFVTGGNLVYMHDNGIDFISALPGNRLDAQALIDGNKWNIRKSANRISEYELYGVAQGIELDGVPMQAHIYYNPEKQAYDEKELYARVEKLQAELEKMSNTKRLTRKYTDYFVIDEKQKDSFAFEIDGGKVDEKLERAGFFVLLSSKPELNSREVLKIYRTRDIVEKNFDQFKNHLDFKRMRTHWAKTTQGKMFVGFLALILRSDMLRRAKGDTQIKNLTFDKILIELRKIRAVKLSDMSEVLTPLTKLQRTILDALGVAHDRLLCRQ
jgi:transposase